jgi:cytochrome c oxidase cbb3-type subunit 3
MKKLIPAYLEGTRHFLFVFGVMEYFIDSGSQPAFIKYPMVYFICIFLLIAIEITVSAVDNIMFQLTEEQKLAVSSAVSYKDSEWSKI